MKIVLFEDSYVDRLFPVAMARPAYAVTCGAKRLIDWVVKLGESVCGIVRPHLEEIQKLDFPNLESWNGHLDQETLFINARIVPSRTSFEILKEMVDEKQYGVFRTNEAIAAALVPAEMPADAAQKPKCLDLESFDEAFADLKQLESDLTLINYPHDIVRYNLEIIDENLNELLRPGVYREVQDNVFLGENSHLGEHLVFDTSDGPVVIDDRATIGSYTYFRGPVYVGIKAKVIEHSAIKDAASLCHTTKIGGEVEASVIESYTNKQHHGFLGHSYLGSWINLGAGTCNSDLKNTYGDVKMEYGGEKVSSGMQFLGCIMGDYAKTAINTGIFTGKVIGLASMLYGFVTTNVPSFVNYARGFGQVTEMPPEVMVATQKRMFTRRDVDQRPCDIQLIHDLFELTKHERQIAGEPLAL